MSTLQKNLVNVMAEKYLIQPDRLLDVLSKTAFKQKGDIQITREQMAALLAIAQEYDLNPFTRELYAFPHNGGIVPVVGVDGWSKIINNHPQLDGLEFRYGPNINSVDQKSIPEWVEAVLYRKDRSHPTVVREYFDECSRDTIPWITYPKRMLRHKALIQAARVGFGFTGIHDAEEARDIIDLNPQENVGKAVHYNNADVIELVKKVAERSRGNWQRGIQYLESKLHGQNLDFALEQLEILRKQKEKALPLEEQALKSERAPIAEANIPQDEPLVKNSPSQEEAMPVVDLEE